MIYLAVFNVPVPQSATSPLGFKGRVGRRGQEGGGRQDKPSGEAAALWGDFLKGSGQSLGRPRIFYPKIYACVKGRRAARVCWFINELPLTKDGSSRSHKQHLHGRPGTPRQLPTLLHTVWARWRAREAPGIGRLGASQSSHREPGTSPPPAATLACPRGIYSNLYSIKKHQTPPGRKPATTDSGYPPHSSSDAGKGLHQGPHGEGRVHAHLPPPQNPSPRSGPCWGETGPVCKGSICIPKE